MLSLEVLPTVMDAQKSELMAFTNAAVSGLEMRVNERLQGVEQRLMTLIEQRQRDHDDELRGIGSKLDGLAGDISAVKSGFNAWEVQLEHVAGINQGLRDMQVAQAAQSEAIQTLQSDVYGMPARGRQTIFGMIDELTSVVGKLADKVEASSTWIEAENSRQAEARQRWANRQQAALALVKMIPSQAWIGVMAGLGAACLIFLKTLGG